jgi:hypothetical protein
MSGSYDGHISIPWDEHPIPVTETDLKATVELRSQLLRIA